MKDPKLKNADKVKETSASFITSIPCCINAVIHTKEPQLVLIVCAVYAWPTTTFVAQHLCVINYFLFGLM